MFITNRDIDAGLSSNNDLSDYSFLPTLSLSKKVLKLPNDDPDYRYYGLSL